MKYLILLLTFTISGLSIGQIFSELIKVVADDRESQDRFGWSVDISGNYAIVGAYADDFGGTNPNMGSAYIFEKEGIADWALVQKIFNSDQDDYDRFGWSVAIDGDYVVVGAYAEDHNLDDADNQSKAGSAYIFERGGDGVWDEVQKIIASDRAASDEFGWSVDISGTTLVVGAHFEDENAGGGASIYNAGSAYIFDREVDGTWTETQKIVGSGRAPDIDFPDGGGGDELSDLFGGSVSISGDRLIIGAHHSDFDEFDGAPLNEAGAAYIFERSGPTWSEVAKLDNSDRATEDRFGFSVSIDGDFAVVSAYSEDQNAGGATTMANSGSAYIFERDGGGSWSQTQKIVASDRSPGDRFGWDIYLDGETLVAGALETNGDEDDESPLSNAGAAYAFSYDGDSGTWIEINKMDASDRQIDDELGVSVAISGTGIILGAYQQNFDETGAGDIHDAGAAYFYSQEECTPSFSSQTLTLCEGQVVEVGPYTHDETGTYTDVIFSESGCDSTVTTNLTITPAPSASYEASICFGYSYEIGGSSYTESGTYVDAVSSDDGCDSLITTILTISPENAVTQDVTICWGETYIIGASTYEAAGVYTDVVTSWALCDCTITTNLMVQLPVDNSVSQSLNTLMAGSDDATYQWIKCSPFEEIPGATDQTYVAPAIGQYAVIVTEGVCSDTSSCLYVDILSNPSYLVDENFKIYPNPSNGNFTISFENPNSNQYEGVIFNALGEVIHEFQLKKPTNSFDLNNLPKGVYVLSIVGDDSADSYRLVIQ
ncbi:MAG: T9SS type A sorting domain-containing protein [Crocinitomix sp.]|nr:T9SS type A sorting domain-containing protein [Crocinitomix sp.]